MQNHSLKRKPNNTVFYKAYYGSKELLTTSYTCYSRMHMPKTTITQTTHSRDATKTPSDMKGHDSARHVHFNSTTLWKYLTLLPKSTNRLMNMIQIDCDYTSYDPDQVTQAASNGAKSSRSFVKAGGTTHLSRVPGPLQEP